MVLRFRLPRLKLSSRLLILRPEFTVSTACRLAKDAHSNERFTRAATIICIRGEQVVECLSKAKTGIVSGNPKIFVCLRVMIARFHVSRCNGELWSRWFWGVNVIEYEKIAAPMVSNRSYLLGTLNKMDWAQSWRSIDAGGFGTENRKLNPVDIDVRCMQLCRSWCALSHSSHHDIHLRDPHVSNQDILAAMAPCRHWYLLNLAKTIDQLQQATICRNRSRSSSSSIHAGSSGLNYILRYARCSGARHARDKS